MTEYLTNPAILISIVSTVVAIWAIRLSRQANRTSEEIRKRDTKTDVRVGDGPMEGTNRAASWHWVITNVSRAAIIDVEVCAVPDREGRAVAKGQGQHAMWRPAVPDLPHSKGAALRWGTPALSPFETAYFVLSEKSVPNADHDTFLTVSWTEIGGKQDKQRFREFRLFRNVSAASGQPAYGKEVIDSDAGGRHA